MQEYTVATMLRRTLATTLLCSIPLAASALSWSDSANRYTDEQRLSRAEYAAVSVLTDIGAVSGNPDGSFDASRALNRAEFLKIVLLSRTDLQVDASSAANCFPDVPADAWFSAYVCYAKQAGIVGGYPDGTFKPSQVVNYAEALKMLVGVFDLTLGEPTSIWYEQYVSAADRERLLLPVNIEYGSPITRGQMARLAASFYAHGEGDLETYRLFERGISSVSSSQSSSSVETSSSSSSAESLSSYSSSSSESSESSDSSVSSSMFPATSHFLLLGHRTPVLMDGQFTLEEESELRQVTVELFDDIESFSVLELVNEDGDILATLTLDSFDSEDTTWRTSLPEGERAILPLGGNRLGIRAVMKEAGQGSAGELVDFDRFYLEVVAVESRDSRQVLPIDLHRPMHQTALSQIVTVENSGGVSGDMTPGTLRTVGSFSFEAQFTTGAILDLEELSFSVTKSGVTASNWRIGSPSPIQQESCALDNGNSAIVVCPVIPDSLDTIGSAPRTLMLFADISLSEGAQGAFIQASLADSGGVGSNGDVQWTDGSARFTWVDLDAPMAEGTLWRVAAEQ